MKHKFRVTTWWEAEASDESTAESMVLDAAVREQKETLSCHRYRKVQDGTLGTIDVRIEMLTDEMEAEMIPQQHD